MKKEYNPITVIYQDGSRYEGEWKDGKRDGEGTYSWADGSKYKGEWKDGKRDGEGTYTYPDGRRYEGEFKDGKFCGQGELTYPYPDGRRYEGQWKYGKKHGEGTYSYPDGRRYEGEWENGKKHGEGTYSWVDGSRYEGEWKDGKKDGKGTYSWAEGSKYKGEFKDGKFYGQGELTYPYPDGSKYKGEWKDNHIMLQSEKTKKQNKTPTLLLRSTEINSQNSSLRYETHKFLEGGEEVKVAVCKNEEEVFKEIYKFSENHKNKSRCRIVFSQKGNSGGINDMKIDKDFARLLLKKLAHDGIKKIIISDEASSGATAYHFLPVAQEVADSYKVKITLRYALEGRSCVSGLKWNGEDSRLTKVTFGSDGLATPRNETVFRPQHEKLISANQEQLR
jgi:hypothetical protein